MHIYVGWIVYLSNINGDDRFIRILFISTHIKMIEIKTFRYEVEGGLEIEVYEDAPSPFSAAA